MKVEIFTLCDAATDQQGKLNILGSFDTIWTKEVPLTYQACAIAIRVRLDSIEEGNHQFKIAFTNADGQPVMTPIEIGLSFQFEPNQMSLLRNLVVNLQGIGLKELGEHSIQLAIDGRTEASVPLYVCQLEQSE